MRAKRTNHISLGFLCKLLQLPYVLKITTLACRPEVSRFSKRHNILWSNSIRVPFIALVNTPILGYWAFGIAGRLYSEENPKVKLLILIYKTQKVLALCGHFDRTPWRFESKLHGNILNTLYGF